MKLSQKMDEAKLHLDSLDHQAFDKLDFDWEGIKFQAASSKKADGSHSILLNATLGRLYFTVEDKNQRALALERLFTTNRKIDGLYQIGKKGDIRFKSITKTNSHLTGTDLISALTIILLESGNHLRALQSHLKPNHFDVVVPVRRSA